jgi:hypothetical protein
MLALCAKHPSSGPALNITKNEKVTIGWVCSTDGNINKHVQTLGR